MLMNISGQSEHHSMVGSVKDPEDPQGVAASIFAAVAVYAVRHLPPLESSLCENDLTGNLMLMESRPSSFSAASKRIYMCERARGER